MEAIVFQESEGEVRERGAARMRFLAQAPGPVHRDHGQHRATQVSRSHTFSNPESKPARLLSIFQPAGFEAYLKEAFERMAEGHPWSPAEIAEIASRYDFVSAMETA